jgi:hypothetical protein
MPCDIDQLLRDVQTLPPEQRALLRQALDGPDEPVAQAAPAPTADPRVDAEMEYQRQLLAAGLIHEIKPWPRDAPVKDAWAPVTIQGKPLSETIIEERR